MKGKFNNLFRLKEHNTTVKGEIVAGLTSFFAIVYIIAVNSSILSDAGLPIEGAVIATILSSFVGCLIIAFMANVPVTIVPGMGVNALFSYTIAGVMGLSWKEALAAVFISGIVFFIVAFTKLATMLTESIPTSLKESITVGIGLLITFIGLQKSGIIIDSQRTFVALGHLSNPEVYVTFINLVLTLTLFIMNVPGNFLIGMIGGTFIAYFFGLVDMSELTFSGFSVEGYKQVFFSMDFSNIASLSFWIAVFSLTLVLVFENLGLLHAHVNVMLKQPHKYRTSFKACAISAITCGILGTSPTVATIESAAGIADGGKTGLTSVITGSLFLIALFFLPFIKIIPNSAISPILIIIGGLMMKNTLNIDLHDFTEGFPAFLTIVMIPLTFSIVDGMAFGFIAYPIVKIANKKAREVSIPMYVISVTFFINFILHAVS
ncbi:AGZA family xanthine/uracil permease-like MFS transporter [Clostridium tetanomorphum]|uniref:NCS2 family permease n=1 Tax=Clostridium tetanomorphum TaxID=1553 RepID=A0A923E8A5_CLOTT|nr:NCS2 family permease [Clostridium tetanomorphum]KAJ51980.1 xanthine/uracil permease family protein [Clostridium tetanomorphum DSM 665]MBC2396981.1 NCS2 family permease [Clostridium tetanomorphum]MBP1862900.1 AGZA family xanthine/uracil permease-like MFS transporter [Clostridium tetanomorphum]NRS87037.1 AGZA family xanthine/uracil permease-like MFS transporter [Clostridium tetanomorphum]NRZ99177.1 AGZA family xanthine/uracil permease-like MFS transporter [Clostridium tetanomorphum]